MHNIYCVKEIPLSRKGEKHGDYVVKTWCKDEYFDSSVRLYEYNNIIVIAQEKQGRSRMTKKKKIK